MVSHEILSGAGLTPAAGSAFTATTGSIAATLASASGRTAWVTGFDITGTGATTGIGINPTLTGLAAGAGSTLNYGLQVPAGVTAALPNGGLFVKFDKPLPASGQNVNIVLNVPTFGSGGTCCAANVYGYLSNP